MTEYTSDDELAKLSKELWSNLTPDEEKHNNNVTSLCSRCETIIARNKTTGETEEYYFAEHANLGPGWMMMRTKDPHLGVVSSFDLEDLQQGRPRLDRHSAAIVASGFRNDK